jgi:integrase
MNIEDIQAQCEGCDLPRMSPETANAYLATLQGALEFAVREGYVTRNVARGITFKNPTYNPRNARHPFSPEQLEKIFNSTKFLEAKLSAKPARFWVPLLGLTTGMRLGEICQLNAEDVRIIQGISVIVVDANDGKRVKGSGSVRVIPLHREIIAIGFLEYVEQRKKLGGRLFPDLPVSTTGYESDPFSKWFNRTFLPGAGAKTPRTNFHSFRHLFKDAMREASIPEERSRALLGHKEEGMAAIYGSGPSVRALANEMQKITFPVDLAHLHRAPDRVAGVLKASARAPAVRKGASSVVSGGQ